MIERFKRYIEEGPWEEQFDAGMRQLEKWLIRPIVIIAALYFGIGVIWGFGFVR